MYRRRRAAPLIVFAVSPETSSRKMDKGVVKRGVKVHRSVKTRMLAKGMNGGKPTYEPAILFLIDNRLRKLGREEWLAEPKSNYFEWVQ